MTELEIAMAKLKDKSWRMSHLYKIQTKDRRLITYKRKLAQKNYASCKASRNLILKARQLGFTTECLIDFLDDTIITPNTNTAIVAHKADKVVKLFEIVKRAYENLPQELKPKVSLDNRNELYFPELDSKIYVTMDSRGETVHNLHVSEAHFIKNAEEMMAGTLEAVPKGGRINLESTGNGVAGLFYNEWEDPMSEYKKHFYNWLWDFEYFEDVTKPLDELIHEYQYLSTRYGTIPDIRERFNLTPQQLQWYINKVRRHKELVVQEYPTTALEAFLATGRNVFHMIDLQRHVSQMPIDRKWSDLLIWEQPLKGFKYVMGVDPAEGRGGDNSVIEVFNAHTGVQAAEFASNFMPPDRLGRLATEVGRLYNKAYINVEANNHGHATLDAMKHRYNNLYRRTVLDRRTNETQDILGFNSNGRTKPLLVDHLEQATRDQEITINSEELLKEMKIFVQTDEPGKNGFGAEGSGHDDRVIACGLAVELMRETPRMKLPETSAQKRLREYVTKHGLPQYFSNTENDPAYDTTSTLFEPESVLQTFKPSQIITGHNRPDTALRK